MKLALVIYYAVMAASALIVLLDVLWLRPG